VTLTPSMSLGDAGVACRTRRQEPPYRAVMLSSIVSNVDRNRSCFLALGGHGSLCCCCEKTEMGESKDAHEIGECGVRIIPGLRAFPKTGFAPLSTSERVGPPLDT